MTREEWAQKLNGREYGSEMDRAEQEQAKADGVLIVFGYSDDGVELRGTIYDEIGAYNGTTFHVVGDMLLPPHKRCECKFCGYDALAAKAATIKAKWCETKIYSWTFDTKLPHSKFDIMEDDEKFCRGIVINAADIPK